MTEKDPKPKNEGRIKKGMKQKNMSVSSLISGDVHGLIQVRGSQAKVTKYVKNRVLLTPSQSTRTTVRSTTTEYKNDPEINKIQYR